MDPKLEAAIEAARAAGKVALHYFRGDFPIEYKGDRSPVTPADRECEARIVEVLQHAFPQYGVLGEELGERRGSGSRWIIDPIDGTKNFIRGIPYFATLIGLEEDGEVTVGVVYAPAVDDLLYAQRGHGAFDGNGRLAVSRVTTLQDGLVTFGGVDIFRRTGHWRGFERLVRASGRQRGFGDYFGHTFVARGQAEAMVELDVKPWDLAAIKILVEEAGGRFTDFDGTPTIYGGNAVASNGLVHDDIVGLLRETPEPD
ncbi:MAG: inositol monophosphatase family protein [Candidatus Binatia bacterium]